jgi:hypothetical protein
MGFDVQGIRFLLAARRTGVSFERTATLGRQELFIGPSYFRETLQAYGVPNSEAEGQRLLTEAGGYADSLLRFLGGRQIRSIDASSYEGADIVHDMNLPIPETLRSAFSAVIDGGTLEHVFNFPVAIKNCMEMVELGGHLLLITPANNFMGHGFYQFSPELLFRLLSSENGFRVERAIFSETVPGSRWYEIVDPERARRRVELTNSRPAYLLFQARKVSQIPVLVRAPQQSDYTVLWGQLPQERTRTRGVHPWGLPIRLARRLLRPAVLAVRQAGRLAIPGQRVHPDSEVFIEVDWLP